MASSSVGGGTGGREGFFMRPYLEITPSYFLCHELARIELEKFVLIREIRGTGFISVRSSNGSIAGRGLPFAVEEHHLALELLLVFQLQVVNFPIQPALAQQRLVRAAL